MKPFELESEVVLPIATPDAFAFFAAVLVDADRSL